MRVTYHIAKHDGGWAYQLGGAWSESFPSHERALSAAKAAALRQELPGNGAEILYQDTDGHWHQEYVSPNERPRTEVVDG